MNKFLVVFLTLCIIGQTQAAKFRRLSKSSSRRRLIGDLHHKHRRLSKSGQLKLKIKCPFTFILITDRIDDKLLICDPSVLVPSSLL